jgi:flagellar basal body P-ring protein FlgI
MIAQLICFTLGLILFGFGLFVGVYPQGDQTVGVLIMFGGLAQMMYSFGVSNE